MYNPWGILKSRIPWYSRKKLSNRRVVKEISSALAENIDRSFKNILKSADKKRKSTCEIKQNYEICRLVGHCLESNLSAEICHTHTLRRYQPPYNLDQLVHKNTASSKSKNWGLKNLPRASFATLRKINVKAIMARNNIIIRNIYVSGYICFST